MFQFQNKRYCICLILTRLPTSGKYGGQVFFKNLVEQSIRTKVMIESFRNREPLNIQYIRFDNLQFAFDNENI